MTANAAQHTPGWYRSRLGNITGSMVGVLMKYPRGKEDGFTDTAMNYLYQLAAERTMNPAIVDDDTLFAEYLQQVDATTKAMRWGTEQEQYARALYARKCSVQVVEVGSIPHPSIPHFASSPDGFGYDDQSGTKTCVEIKCPTQATYMKYRHELLAGGSLLGVKPEYYYQCMAHMMCTGALCTDFVAYCPFQAEPLLVIPVWEDVAVFRKVEERVMEANKIIDSIIGNKAL